MYIHHLRKTTFGSGGNMSRSCGCGGKILAKPHKRYLGSGITPSVYDSNLGVVKPSRVLQNIKIKKSGLPKKYITFE
jgi:hypothetical protein